MSRPVDEIIVNDIKKDLLEDMMIGDNDIDVSTIDFMCGWDEEAQEYVKRILEFERGVDN